MMLYYSLRSSSSKCCVKSSVYYLALFLKLFARQSKKNNNKILEVERKDVVYMKFPPATNGGVLRNNCPYLPAVQFLTTLSIFSLNISFCHQIES